MSASVSSGLSCHAAPIEIEFNGETIKLKPLQWKSIISASEAFLIGRALKIKMVAWQVKKEMGLMTQEEVDAAESAFSDDCIENGTYSFGRPVMMKILGMAERGEIPEDPKAKGKHNGKSKGKKTEKEDPNNGVIFEGQMHLVSLFTGLSIDQAIQIANQKSQELWAKISLVMKQGLPSPPKAMGDSRG
jgi:hypothetical protein